MCSAWIFQDPHQLKHKGPDLASWVVGWYEPDCHKRTKAFGPRSRGQMFAE